jgi:hypothetical protein
MPKSNWNNRLKSKEVFQKRKTKEHLIMQKVTTEETMDITGEVLQDTVIKLKFEDAIIIHLSVAAAMKLESDLQKVLYKK